MKKTIFILSAVLTLLTISCKKEEPEPTTPTNEEEEVIDSSAISPFAIETNWGTLGTSDNQLNGARKISATDSFLFINDVGNSKVKKFDHEGNFLASLNYSKPFYIYNDEIYIVSDTNDTYLHKLDLNFNLVSSYHFNSSIPSGDDISGNSSKALITLGGSSEPFLMSLDFSSLSQNTFGNLGTGQLDFQWNGQFNLVCENGNFVVETSYFITDGGNYRVQELDENFNFVSEFKTNDEGKSVLNSPTVIDANLEYIAVTNGNNGGDQIDFYNRVTKEFLFTQDLGDSFKQSISFIDNKMFVLVDYPSIEIRVYKK